jgi:hypothetical protein
MYHPDMDEMDDHWGSASGIDMAGIVVTDQASGTYAKVEVDVSVNGDDMIRIAAWTPSMSIDQHLILTPEQAMLVRDALTNAITEGRRLA